MSLLLARTFSFLGSTQSTRTLRLAPLTALPRGHHLGTTRRHPSTASNRVPPFATRAMASDTSTHVPPAPGVSKLYAAEPVAGRCALITGASSGIGQATAERLAELGCRLVVAARRKDRLDALAEKLAKDFGTKVHCVALDVTDVDAVMSLPSQLPDDFKDVSILVNNAGGALGTAKCTENNMDDVSVMLDANVKGVIACTRAFSPGMVERGCGHVVNISSIAGVEWYGGGSVYCATKAAINAFTYASRKDLHDTPCKITSVSPGFVNTEFATVRFKGDTTKAENVYAGMKYGGPLIAEDIADNIVYALTRPGRVQVCDVLVYPTCQASAKEIARE
jgi:NADP-dependent 3-hydroxy acid dehydrogenase YdfG